jgi:HEAT repeat protein
LLQGLKTDAAPAADELLNAVKNDPEPQVRGASLVALSHVAPADKVVAAASEALADKDAGVRLVAAARLRQLGKEAAPAAGALAETLADDDQRVREGAADALIRIGSPAVAAVGKMLDSPQVHARQLALACAVRLAPASAELLPAIKKRLKDEDETVRKLAELAVAKLQM